MVKQSLRPNAKVKQCLIQSMTTWFVIVIVYGGSCNVFCRDASLAAYFSFWPAPSNMSPNRRYGTSTLLYIYDIKKKIFIYCCEQMFVT